MMTSASRFLFALLVFLIPTALMTLPGASEVTRCIAGNGHALRWRGCFEANDEAAYQQQIPLYNRHGIDGRTSALVCCERGCDGASAGRHFRC
jgi:hypothetical protein